MVIEILRQEHRNIEKLLDVLERELDVFARGEAERSTHCLMPRFTRGQGSATVRSYWCVRLAWAFIVLKEPTYRHSRPELNLRGWRVR
jgi:hypothetical protein